MGHRAWQSRPPRGSAVDLPIVRTLAVQGDPGPTPQILRRDGRIIAHYSRTRMWLDRDAWEALQADTDLLVLRIRPREGKTFSVALTRRELEQVFGEVRQSKSWDTVRCYHFPNLPPAVEAFRVEPPAHP